MDIRTHQPDDGAELLMLWERSVRATHTFLTEADIATLRPLTSAYLASDGLELWIMTNDCGVVVGFMSMKGNEIEALFLDPAHLRRGAGRRFIAHAQATRNGALTVSVNEQNQGARGFYEAMGFAVTGRSPTDDLGQPFPLLRMRREKMLT